MALPWYYRNIVCRDCGKTERRGCNAKRCRDCQRRREGELHLEAQRRRRAVGSGRLVPLGSGLVPARLACRRCGREFVPRRATARFCSAKCRVYWHRVLR
jgi:hypothetical protein